MSLHVLILDDEPALRQIEANVVARAGHTVTQAATVKEAAAQLARGDIDVALCDIKLPDGSGIDLVREFRNAKVDTAFVMVTGFGSMETAVEALRAGAYDYIVKPIRADEVVHRLEQLEALRTLRDENRALRKVVSAHEGHAFRFSSARMREVERLVGKVAPTDSTVLVTGESGTGKSVIARAIHEQSPRADGPFVMVNCGAIPEHLLESEFFGHTKGAFTSADRARKGLFVQADRGTLFLDELGELPLHMQTKLLHVIEDKEVRPVGGEQARRVDTRIVAATNRDLAGRVAQGLFREDLYFRLSVFHIDIPPLRERPGDIAGLIGHFLEAARARSPGSAPWQLDPEAEEALLAHPWPGNVRQLENVINRAVILADEGRITLGDLPPEFARAARGNGGAEGAAGLREQLRRLEADIIRRAIEEAGGDRRVAAQRLGIGLSSLYRKLEDMERDALPGPRADERPEGRAATSKTANGGMR